MKNRDKNGENEGNYRIVPKNELNSLLKALNQNYKLILPTHKNGENEKGEIIFDYVDVLNTDYEFPEYQNTRISPKRFLFPQKEVLFSYELDGEEVKIQEKPQEMSEQIIFGIRNCDARSFLILDTFFAAGKYGDPYYFNRRDHTLLVGFACNEPMTTCFCTSLNGAPHSVEGYDAVLYELPDKYLFKIISQKGQKLEPFMEKFEGATADDLNEMKELGARASEKIQKTLSLDNIDQELEGLYDDDIWQKVARKCLKCGACSYICPTCHCFDVQEKLEKTGEMGKSRGERIRIWDTCQFPLFTQEASGFNPRNIGNKRTRQRVYHKFNYYPKNYNIIGCVGCGRCIQVCPAHQDIRITLTEVQKLVSLMQKGE